jgi:hypothetical protein
MSTAAPERLSASDAGVFGQVMGPVAATVGVLTLGAYVFTARLVLWPWTGLA